MSRFTLPVVLVLLLPTAVATPVEPEGAPLLSNPVMFVTQMPIAADFVTIGSVFGNHRPTMQATGRGGDLYIRYTDGSLCNLTSTAGFGATGFQGADAIAVRDPAVHWDGARALFSMVIGAPEERFEQNTYYWQIYEVTNFTSCGSAIITRIADQPAEANNHYPIYSPNGQILFVSDLARDKSAHLYPQLDEYESTRINTGVWTLDAATGEFKVLDHSPSGDFDPFVDSFGRVVFTRWDHLQRDQQADADATEGDTYGTFNWSGEGADAVALPIRDEVFPEPRPSRVDLLAGTNLEGHRFNHFLPWQMNPDGTEHEILNHLGRHELHNYFNRTINDDDNVVEFIASVSGRTNPNSIGNLLQVTEGSGAAGTYLAVDAPEFQTHASGMVVRFDAGPSVRPDLVTIDYLTHPDTATVVGDDDTPPPTHSGHYREPVMMSDGMVLASHTFETRAAANEGTRQFPDPRYEFLVRTLDESGTYALPGESISGGISKNISYWDPDELVQYNGELWELNAVEVISRPVPPLLSSELDPIEQLVFDAGGVDVATFKQGLAANGLALMVVRNATTRDALDKQQPFNLRVPGGEQTIGAPGTIYDIPHLQLVQGDLIRGLGGHESPSPGRRVLSQFLHDPSVDNPPNPDGPVGSVAVAADGSIAALVPAARAMAWQLTDSEGTPVVRERNWISFQAGEIRVCDGCHGVNDVNQAGEPAATNSPAALADLLEYVQFDDIFADGFESGDTGAWTSAIE